MNRAAETMRQPRMSQTVIQEPALHGVFEQAGDGYGDSQMRQAKYENLLSDAETTRGLTKNQRNAMGKAAEGLIKLGKPPAKPGDSPRFDRSGGQFLPRSATDHELEPWSENDSEPVVIEDSGRIERE